MRKVVTGLVVALVLFVGAAWAYRAFVLVAPLKNLVLAGMVDPDSAQFANVRYVGSLVPGEGRICGNVNAKNRMGGYVGFEYFEAAGDSAYVGLTPKVRTGCVVGAETAPWWWLTQ